MHVRESLLKLSVVDGIKDPYAQQLIDEHMEVCDLCLGKAAEYADQNQEGKLEIDGTEEYYPLTDKEIADLLQWRDLHKDKLKENKDFDETIKKSFKLK